jgi:hypothetical protein
MVAEGATPAALVAAVAREAAHVLGGRSGVIARHQDDGRSAIVAVWPPRDGSATTDAGLPGGSMENLGRRVDEGEWSSVPITFANRQWGTCLVRGGTLEPMVRFRRLTDFVERTARILAATAAYGMPFRVAAGGRTSKGCETDDASVAPLGGLDGAAHHEGESLGMIPFGVRAGADTTAQCSRSLSAIRLLSSIIDAAAPGDDRPPSVAVAELAERIALAMGWGPGSAEQLHAAALIRDLGRVPVRPTGDGQDAHRGSPGGHAHMAARRASGIVSPRQVRWILEHRERFDGVGNTTRRAGRAISQGARIITVAARWIELREGGGEQGRPSVADALHDLRAEAGSALCPHAVAVLERIVLAEQISRAGYAPAVDSATADELAAATESSWG